jgi:hypothetical protein
MGGAIARAFAREGVTAYLAGRTLSPTREGGAGSDHAGAVINLTCGAVDQRSSARLSGWLSTPPTQ